MWLLAGTQAVAVEAFVLHVLPAACPDPSRLHRHLLARNLRLRGVHYGVDDVGDLFVTGSVPLAAVDAEQIDRVLGEVLELLADASVTIPEIGTIRATHPPVIVLTSNRTRDLHDAVKRRCLYHWIAYPTPEREVEIVRRRVKGSSETLAVQVANAVSRMRSSDVQKPPGVAESIDWATALSALGRRTLDAASVDATLGTVLKYREDAERTRSFGIDALVDALRSRSS